MYEGFDRLLGFVRGCPPYLLAAGCWNRQVRAGISTVAWIALTEMERVGIHGACCVDRHQPRRYGLGVVLCELGFESKERGQCGPLRQVGLGTMNCI